jgi:hypothetical protein
MARMLILRDILELIDNGLENGMFTQEQLIQQGHEFVLHVTAQFGDEMELFSPIV